MPVSTRWQLSGDLFQSPARQKTILRNPHQGLKEKMKALTVLYEQHKQPLAPTHHPSKPARAPARRSSMGSVLEGGRGLTACKKTSEDSEASGDTGSRIMVFVRLRPMGKKEEAGSRRCVRIANRRDVYLTEFASETDYLRLKRVRGRHFCFDAAFPESTSQQEVYLTTTTELVEGVLQGRNGTVFCYGATGAGKTYTMLGTLENPGVMVLAIKDLFSKIRQRSFNGSYSLLLSYLEVYNETVRDLLSPRRPLVLREDKQGTIAAGLTQYRAYSTDEVMQLLQQGNRNRTTEPTRVNETSSRSHAILQIITEYQVKESLNVDTRVGKLSLIDLAGSERALATDLRTQRSIEGANINRSLLALSSCINALVEGKRHIPYRNSKLTQLLKDSLGGPCNTVMIANISPGHFSFNETQNTLHWADRAKEIRTKASSAIDETTDIPETGQAKLLLVLQKENSEKLLNLQAQALSSQSPQQLPPPPAHSSPLISTPNSTNRNPKRSILGGGNCFGTPDSAKRANERVTQELQKRVKELEFENKRLRKEHGVQLKQKDDFIREIISKGAQKPIDREGMNLCNDDFKSSRRKFASPQPTAKKRSFWDISAANSPAAGITNGRKTRSHVAPQSPPPPSMILPPGFAWTKQVAASRQ
ncbi:125 kDa kinesin-related protein [Platanthera zijinensis]|uniref:Kinesin-like protein n=1 Tax=Platanthera zijinensis TaxID=2320716 RepID=A0AAP0FZT5_9ASPA